jgi:hypothetical protein
VWIFKEGQWEMTVSSLDPAYVAELYTRQDALQREAQAVVTDLDLLPSLAQVGPAHQLGSSISGLMVWRDLDFIIICDPALDMTQIMKAVYPLLTHPRTMGLHYANERGSNNPYSDPASDRYYFVFRHMTEQGQTWKIDLSFFFSEQMLGALDHLDWLQRELTEETRLAILWIKDIWHHLPAYPYRVGGYEMYDAVLNAGVRTPDEFDAYLIAHGLPDRQEAAHESSKGAH